MIRLLTTSLFIFLFSSYSAGQSTWQSNRVKVDTNGCLTYTVDSNQNSIPNFSHAGYKGGGVQIPDIATTITIAPISGDNTAHIQNAIDSAGSLPLNTDGFRGAVYLKAGRYAVSGQLFINKSGVVLRGVGDGRDSKDTTIIYGTGNTPAQRDLIILGGGINTQWKGEVSNTQQNITTTFVPVGSYTFTIADASMYAVGDNIIIYHPCSASWLAAINYGGTASDPGWSVGEYPIIYNRYITAISGNEITIDAPVYNHLDLSLSQSYIYKYDRQGIVTNVGFEGIRVEIESLGGTDENHVWNAVQLTEVEDAWVRNSTMVGFGLSGVRTATANHISVLNVHSVDPVAIVTGGRMYNFNSYVCSNNILFDDCYARNGRHHYVSNGVTSVSGFVVLRSISENPHAASEGHRHWTTGMLFDNLTDFGTYHEVSGYVMGFYNRGDYGSSHGWSAAHSVCWNCDSRRPGKDAAIIVEQPPTAQNYAIGCKGKLGIEGPFNKPIGYIEGSNLNAQLVPASLYEAQLLCRTNTVIADFKASQTVLGISQPVDFKSLSQGSVTTYNWNFGDGASPKSASGAGPYEVTYGTSGTKTITLTVSNGTASHTEVKTSYVSVSNTNLYAMNDAETIPENDSAVTAILANDSYPVADTNYAYSFNGVANTIIYDSTIMFDNYPFTMAVWVKTSSSSGQTVIYLGNTNSGVTGNSLSIRSGKAVLEAWIYNGSTTKKDITGTITVNDGKWHHIAGVFAGATKRALFVDGILQGTDTASLDNVTTQVLNGFSVGNRNDNSPSDWFQGDLDEVRVYADAYTDIEIKALMHGWDCTGKEKVLYWNFDDRPTTLERDAFNYFTGIISGGTSVLSGVALTKMSVSMLKNPSNGTAYFSNTSEITYKPSSGFVGKDTLIYQLKVRECDSSAAKVIYTVDYVTGVTRIVNIEAEQFILFPNPSKGYVTLHDQVLSKYAQVKIYNSSGIFVESSPLKKKVDLNHLENGIYILRFEDASGSSTTKKIILSK